MNPKVGYIVVCSTRSYEKEYMSNPADKVTRTVSPVQRQADQSPFFSRKEEGGFFGNKESFFPSSVIQTKLSVSSPDDPQEKEADAMADHVMRMPASSAAPAAKEEEKVQKKCADCEKEEKAHAKLFRMIQPVDAASSSFAASGTARSGSGYSINRKHTSLHHSDVVQRSGRGPPESSTQFEQSLSSSKGGGSALPGDTRDFMENRFNADFSGVRIHTGNQAESMSSNINAQAFTHGNDIYFNAGKYSPSTSQGSSLLAHELTHTIQQGASKHNSSPSSGSASGTTVSAKPLSVSRKEMIHRSAVPSQLTNAVDKAKTVEGKIDANKPQGDGNRTGWEHLVEIFKSVFGDDKIISGSGGSSVEGAVAEEDIKKKREQSGVMVVDKTTVTTANAIPKTTTGSRDAMPSWCGIFTFWALNKSGVPMPKWKLGERMIKPEAARSPGSMPLPGDIAYRNAYSHFAIVESVNGNTVKTVNGNTAGEDNLGGQVQTKDHPLSDWTAFFNPLLIMQGSLGTGEGPAAEKPKTLEELRKDLSKVSRKEQGPEEGGAEGEEVIHTKPELSNWSVNSAGRLQTKKVQPKEEKQEKNEELKTSFTNQPEVQRQQAYDVHCKCNCSEGEKDVQAKHFVQRQATTTNSSLNTYTDAETSDSSAEMDRGPPVQTKLIDGGSVIQRSVIDDALEYTSLGALMDCVYITDLNRTSVCLLGKASEVAMHIPGYKALRVVLGKDPITGNGVERNGRNFIEAAFDIMPGGELLHRKLDEQHQLDAAAAWIDGKIAALEGIVHNLFSRFDQFWGRLGITDFGSPFDVLREGAGIVLDFIADIIRFAVDAAVELLEMVKKFLLEKIVEFIKEKTTAYPLLTVILGEDPITKQKVDRNGTNILNAILELGGEEGRMQRDQMMDTGTFQKAAAYIDEGITVFGNLYQTIIDNFGLIWDIVTIDALMEPLETFTKIFNIFAEPVRDVLDFMARVIAEILKLIKDVLFKRISEEAKKTRGYFLVTVLIHKDPFTGEAVPANVENVIHGFMSLMDGGEEQFQQMKESGAIGRAVAKIDAAVKKLNMTFESVVQLFIDLWNSFSFSDFLHPIDTFRRIIATFGEPIGRLIAFVVEIVKIVVEVILIIMNFPFDLINKIIANAMKAFHLIKADPIGFLKNLLRAIKEGFIQFFDNIVQHLIQGLVGWLTMELKDAGVPELKDLSLKGVISWVLQVLGISMDKIWEKLAKHPRIGPAKVAKIRSAINTLEGIWTFIKDVQERGMAAIWDKIQEQLSNLWTTVLDAVKNWIMEKIITQVTVKLLSMLDPTGIMAVINSCIAIYKAVQSFIKYLRQMLEIVSSFVEGVAEIASGNTKKAANFLEKTLAKGIPIVIGFLANQVGLGGIGKKIGEMIEKAREMVDKALEWLVNKCVDTAFSVIDKLMGGGRAETAKSLEEEYGPEKAAKINAGLKTLHDLEQPLLTSDKLTKEEAEQIAANVKQQHPVFTSFTVVDGGAQWDYEYTASKKTKVTGKPKDIGTVPAMMVTPGFSGTKVNGAMTVKYLYNDKANHTDGSPTTGRESLDGAFEAIQAASLSAYWSRGHILNKDFGGQAVTSNLIPIDQSTNLKQISFDNKIRTAYTAKEAPIYISFNVDRYADDDKFVSSYSGNAVKMKKSGESWTETGGDSIGTFTSGTINKPGAGPKRSIRQLSSQSTTNDYREVGRANNLSVSLLQDIVASGQVMTSAADLTNFISGQSSYSAIKKQRYINRVNGADSAGMLDFTPPSSGAPGVQPKHEDGEKTNEPMNSSSFERSLSSSKGSGDAMSGHTKEFMEDRFDTDFSGVRIHTDDNARNMNSQINSQAFTHGNDIYFNNDKYSPNTAEGGSLLAHELTHTIQQGNSAATAQRKAAKPAPVINAPAQSTSLTMGTFTPTDEIGEYIAAGSNKGNHVNVNFGSYASGLIKVRKNHKGVYETVGAAQNIALQLPFLQPLMDAGIQPSLVVQIKESQVSGYISIGGGGGPNAIFNWIKGNTALMKWSGINFLSKKINLTNKIEGDRLLFEVNDIGVNLGGFVNGTLSIGLSNANVIVSGNAIVKIKSLADGSLNFSRDAAGNLKGSFMMQTSIKNFNGTLKGDFLNGIFDIRGTAGYHTEKLSGEVNIIVTDARQAQTLVLQQLEPQQISKAAEERAGVSEPAAGPQPGPRAIAGWGTLNFSFNKWLTGAAKVIVDSEGYVTVHGEITPPAEVTLFKPKPYRSPNFIDIHPTFRWGIPYVADLHVGLDFLLYAEAQIGPAVLRNIKVIGNYSTDPLLFNDFRLQATFNMMGYAGLVFEFGAHAGVGILGFDIDLGGKLKATAGIKGYVDATPVIGYREVADPVAGKKGEFFVSGEAELAAQPFLGLEGLITLEVDSPWPIPNFGREWSMFKKEYALPGQFGIGMKFPEYVLGSDKWPDVDFNKVSFDEDKFKDDLIDRNIPPKQDRAQEKKGGFADKMQGQEPAPPPPPIPVAANKGPKGGKEKEVAAPTKATLDKWGKGMKVLKALKDKRDDKPVAAEQLQTELKSIRRSQGFANLIATPSGINWSIYAEMPGINNSMAPIGIKGIPEVEKLAEEKAGGGKPAGDKPIHEKYEPEKAVKISAGIETLHKLEKPLLSNGKITKEEAEQVAATVKQQHPVFTSFKVADGGTRWDYLYTASEQTKLSGPLKDEQKTKESEEAEELANLEKELKNILQPFLDEYNGLSDTNSIFVTTNKLQTQPAQRVKVKALGIQHGCLAPCHTPTTKQTWVVDHIPPTELKNAGLMTGQTRLYPQSREKARQQGILVKNILDLHRNKETAEVKKLLQNPLINAGTGQSIIASSDSGYSVPEQAMIQAIGDETGCHHGGGKEAATDITADHIPSSVIVDFIIEVFGIAIRQRLAPSCTYCADTQGPRMRDLAKSLAPKVERYKQLKSKKK